MPREYYTSPDVLRRGARAHLRAPVELRRPREPARAIRATTSSATVAGESMIIVRDRGGELRAFFNVCRHRGTRICRETSGPVLRDDPVPVPRVDVHDRRPAHRRAAHAGGRGLRQARLSAARGRGRRVGRFRVREHRPTTRSRSTSGSRRCSTGCRASGSRDLDVGHSVTYDVQANWKLVFQNYSECLHCPMIHPELSHGAAVPERRERSGRRTVPRRLHGDHAAERERDAERPRLRAAREPGAPRRRPAPRVLLLADAESHAQHPSRLRELLSAHARRGGSDDRRIGVDVPSATTKAMRHSIPPTRSGSGTSPIVRTGTSSSGASSASRRAATSPGPTRRARACPPRGIASISG